MIQLREYQEDIACRGVEILTSYKMLYLCMEVRTGKTLTVLSIYDRMNFKNVLFLTKKKAIASVQADYESLNPSFDLMVTNYEQAAKLINGKNHKPFDAVIIDEGQNVGAFPKPSKRFLLIRQICAGLPVTIMSGTPSPESYSQLYHQLNLSSYSPLKIYSNFYKFAKVYVNVKQKHLNGYVINDYSDCDGNKLWKDIKHLFIMFSQKEAGFVADVDETILEVEMSAESRQIYKELEKQKIHVRTQLISGEEIICTINSGGDMITKLCQISSGTLIFDNNQKGIIIDPSKARFIRSYFAGKKIAIFYRFKSELELLQDYFPNWTDSPEIFNTGSDRVFLGQVQSAREGVNLSTADALVMYNIDFSATSYFQARARIQSKERQGSAPLFWIFSSHGIERKVYEAVTNKINFTYSYYRKSNAGKRHTVPTHSENKEEGIISRAVGW